MNRQEHEELDKLEQFALGIPGAYLRPDIYCGCEFADFQAVCIITTNVKRKREMHAIFFKGESISTVHTATEGKLSYDEEINLAVKLCHAIARQLGSKQE